MSIEPPTTSNRGDSTPVRPRSHRRVLWVAGVVAAVALTAAGCASTTPSAAPSPAPAPGKHRDAHGVRGTVQAENGNTWTVSTRAGKQVTVTLSPTTVFGTKTAPATAQQFPVGSSVRVEGPVTGTAVAATRISAAKTPVPATATPAAPAPA